MTNEELTAIYNEANGLDPKRHNPITMERIFAAMREAVTREREECANECERMVMYPGGRQEAPAHNTVWDAAGAIRMRSNSKGN